jgi:hypothetical protein
LKEIQKKLTGIVFGRGVGEKPCERAGRHEGLEREPKGQGEQGRAGSNETSICSMIKGRKKAYNN